MDYQQALDYIYSLIDYETIPRPAYDSSRYDLRRMFELLERLGNPHLQARSVHITGTKGKGSTSAMIASVLNVAGLTTGLYTSPHLISLNERIQVNREPILNNDLVALTEGIKPEIEAVNRKATYGQLTTFEALTALAFAYFRQRAAEWQVLEVGLGGRLDATNVIQPDVAVITSISLDHTEVLGHTRTAIAGEKAGIIKPRSTVVISQQTDDVDGVLAEACSRQGARLFRVGRDIIAEGIRHDLSGQWLKARGRLDTYELFVPLLGQYQLDNAAAALGALEVLVEKGIRISRDDIIRGLAEVEWPGRFQILGQRPLMVVDGAHNVDSAQKLSQALTQYCQFHRAILIIGLSYDKDIAGVAAALAPLFREVIVTRSRHPRAAAAETLVAEFARQGLKAEVARSVSEALALAWTRAKEGDLICATGSLFVVGEVLEETGSYQP